MNAISNATTQLSHSPANSNQTTTEKIYFYNRSDYIDIINKLSPLRYILENYVQHNLEILGLVANLLCILVLCQKTMLHRKSIIYLVYLAVADFMFIFLTKLPRFLIMAGVSKNDVFKTSNLSCFFFDLRTTVFHVYSILLTLTVTVDRFYAIYNPLKSHLFVLSRYSKLIGLCLFFLSSLISLPHGYLMVYNEMEKDCDARDFFKQKINGTDLNYYQVYFTFTEPVIIWFVPGALILCMNSYVIVKIVKSQKRRTKLLTSNFDDAMTSSQKASCIRFDSVTFTPSGNFKYSDKDNQKPGNIGFACFCRKKKSDVNCKSENLYRLVENPTKNCDTVCRSETSSKKNGSKKLSVRISVGPSSSHRSSQKQSKNKMQTEQFDKASKRIKISVNQISHYVTIMVLGFYFILSTIPYGVLLSFQNNLTLKLDYYLSPAEIYKDRYWINYGNFRQLVGCAKVFFTSNHSLNFFVYLVFNKVFRFSFFSLIYRFINLFKCFKRNTKQSDSSKAKRDSLIISSTN
jgi:hypothetical protein